MQNTEESGAVTPRPIKTILENAREERISPRALVNMMKQIANMPVGRLFNKPDSLFYEDTYVTDMNRYLNGHGEWLEGYAAYMKILSNIHRAKMMQKGL